MIAVTALVLGFIVLGLAVVAAGFSGGRSEAKREPSRAGNRLVYIGCAIVILTLGIGIPVLVGVNNADNAKADAVGGVDLTEQQVAGRALFAQSCSNCHTLRASNSVGKIGPNLDVLRPPSGLVENAVLQGRARGSGNMPAGLFTGEDAKQVAAYVAAVAGR